MSESLSNPGPDVGMSTSNTSAMTLVQPWMKYTQPSSTARPRDFAAALACSRKTRSPR